MIDSNSTTGRNDPKLVLALVSSESTREILQNAVISFGQSLEVFEGAEPFVARLDSVGADVLVLDLDEPKSLRLLRHLHTEGNHRPVLVLAGLGRRT